MSQAAVRLVGKAARTRCTGGEARDAVMEREQEAAGMLVTMMRYVQVEEGEGIGWVLGRKKKIVSCQAQMWAR